MWRRLKDWFGRKLLGLTPDELLTVRDITREFTAIRLEWAETADFIQHWASRQAKRDQRATKRALEEPPEPMAQEGVSATDKAALRRLAASQRVSGSRFPVHQSPEAKP